MRVRIRLRDEREFLYTRWSCLVYKISQKMALKWNMPLQELNEEGISHLATTVCEHWHNYDGDKSSEQTWIYQCIYWHLWIYCEKETKRRGVSLLDTDERSAPTSWVACLLSELGDEGRALCRALFEAPGELAGLVSPRAPVRSKRAVTKHMVTKELWSEDKVQRAWDEVERCVV